MASPIWGESNDMITLALSDRFRSIINRKGAQLGHMLLLNVNINRKVYVESQSVQLHFILAT